MCACTCRDARRSTEWVCERTLARERAAGEHLPDGVVLVDGQRVAIEVELTVKSRRRVTAILDELSGALTRSLYFCAPAPHRQLTSCAPRALAVAWRSASSRQGRRLVGGAVTTAASARGVLRTPQAARRVATIPRASRLPARVSVEGERGSRSRDASPASARCRSTAAWCCSRRSGCAAICSCAARRAREDRDGAAPRLGGREAERRARVLPRRQGRPRDRGSLRGLMADAGRRTRVFPNEPFDGWRGRRMRSRVG